MKDRRASVGAIEHVIDHTSFVRSLRPSHREPHKRGKTHFNGEETAQSTKKVPDTYLTPFLVDAWHQLHTILILSQCKDPDSLSNDDEL